MTDESISGWHSGISDGVCLAPMIPASRATRERVALGHAVAAQQRDDLRRDQHPAGGGGGPGGDVLAGDVDHPRRAGLVDVGQASRLGRLSAIRTPRRAAATVHLVAPASSEVTSSGTTISALDCGQVADQVRAVPADRRRRDAPAAVDVVARRARTARGPRGEVIAVGEACASTVGRAYGSRPISLRIAGSTNISKEMYDDTGLPGSVKIGVSSSPTSAEALRLARLHGDPAEPDGARAARAPP